MALQRELLAHLLQQLCDQAQLIGERGIQQEIRRGLEPLDIPGLAVQHTVPHGQRFGRAAAAGGGVAQGAAAQADILGVDGATAVDAVFLPQARIDAVDLVARNKARQLRVEGVDALHNADAAFQVDLFRLTGACLLGKIVDGQHGLARLVQLLEALADEGQIQRVGVLIVQRAVRQAGVILGPPEEVVQADHPGRGALALQLLGQLMSRGGLAAG